MSEQPGSADEGLVPALLFDPKYRNVLEDVKVVAHNFREVSDRLVGGKGTLGGLVKDEPADASIRQASRDLQAALANLREITGKSTRARHHRRPHRRSDGLRASRHDPRGAQRSFLLRGLLKSLGGGGKPKEGE